MHTKNSHIGQPEVTAKGTAMAMFFWLLYTLFSTALLSYSENLAFIYAFSGMGMSSMVMAVLMIPAWFLIVREMHQFNEWIKAAAHLVTSIIYTFSWYYLYLWIFDLTVGREVLGQSFTQNSQWILFTTFLVYVITFAVIHTIESLKQLRFKEKQAADLKELSRKQEISTLKAQLNPHFLFNTLNSINATVTKNPQKTREMISKLSEMLRYSLDSFERDRVALREELKFVKTYLGLEQQRLGSRLQSVINADDHIKELPVPPMILQPLVENAVKHGISPLPDGGEITIEVKERSNQVIFTVEDTGKGISENYKESKSGIGLRNVDKMLTKRFGKNHGLSVSNNHPKGTRVSFSIPIE